MRTGGMLGRLSSAASYLMKNNVQKRHVLIAGTGRVGTTLLVRIFFHLGLDTGFTREDISSTEENIGRAGLEKKISIKTSERLPEIIKSPHVVDVLSDGLSGGWLKVDHAIIPVRDLASASQSRRAVREKAIEMKLNPNMASGGLWKTADPEQQETVLAIQFYQQVETLVAHDIPLTLISFPRFATDPDYFVAKLGAFLKDRYNLDADALRSAHAAECRPDFIGEYGT